VATASLYELGSVAYCIGTLGYIPAGSLGIAECPVGVRTLGNAGASLFVAGSVFYTLGALITFIAVAYLTYNQPYNDGGATILRGLPNDEESLTKDGSLDETDRVEGGEGLFAQAEEEGVWQVGGEGEILNTDDAGQGTVSPVSDVFTARGWLIGAVDRATNGTSGYRSSRDQSPSQQGTTEVSLPPAGDGEEGGREAPPRADLVTISEYLAESDAADILAALSPLQRRELAARLQAAPEEVVRIRAEPELGLHMRTPSIDPQDTSSLEPRSEVSLAADALVAREALLLEQLQDIKEAFSAAASREARLDEEASRVLSHRDFAKQELERTRLMLRTAERILEEVREELDAERLAAEDAREWFS